MYVKKKSGKKNHPLILWLLFPLAVDDYLYLHWFKFYIFHIWIFWISSFREIKCLILVHNFIFFLQLLCKKLYYGIFKRCKLPLLQQLLKCGSSWFTFFFRGVEGLEYLKAKPSLILPKYLRTSPYLVITNKKPMSFSHLTKLIRIC